MRSRKMTGISATVWHYGGFLPLAGVKWGGWLTVGITEKGIVLGSIRRMSITSGVRKDVNQ